MTDSAFGGSPPELFQFAGSGLDELPSAVNLFHGDVSLSRTLVKLAVREGEDSPLSVELAIHYSSNVAEVVKHSNLTHPTGVLGVGWHMPMPWIQASPGELPASGTRTYILHNADGTIQKLVQEEAPPFLFAMPGINANTLHNGEKVPAEVVDAFLAHGLRLDSSATVSGKGPWRIEDIVNQQDFTLEHGSSGVDAYDGGESFQCWNYAFEKIIYYPTYERWVVTNSSGIRQEFGGTSDPAEPGRPRSSYNNSIGWHVWWTDSAGAPAWTGPSNEVSGQVQVARAWHLATIRNPFGDAVEYSYAQECQPVGASGSSHGLEYTRAVHLDKIVDSYGRTVTLKHGDKLWSDEDEAPREYVDPFGESPSGPRVFQPLYATRYLQQLDLNARDGELLYRVHLHYDPRPDQTGRDREVANLTTTTGRLRGNTYKRFLTGVTMEDRDGITRPGMDFAPYLTDIEEVDWSGAMREITFPSGATAHYDYDHQALDVCKRNITLPRVNAIPRVFFGPDYAVTCRYDPSAAILSLRVDNWSGRWVTWTPFEGNDGLLLDGEAIDLNSLSVSAGSDTLIVQVDRSNPVDKAVFVFQRAPLNPELWHPAEIDNATAATNSPTLAFDRIGHDVTLSSGESYFTVARMAHNEGGTIHRYSYDEIQHGWQVSSHTVNEYTHANARDNYYVLLDHQGKLCLHYRDGKRNWHESNTSLQLDLGQVDQEGSIAAVPGRNVLAITHLTQSGRGWNRYQLFIVSWGASYEPRLEVATSFVDEYTAGMEVTGAWWPHLIEDTMVGVAGHLFRFDGSQWLENSNLCPATPRDGRQQRYAYARDYAVLMLQPASDLGTAECYVLAYDPVQHSGAWMAEPVKIDQPWPHEHPGRDNWPRLGHDTAIIGPYLYYRDQATNWEEVFKGDPLDLRTTLPAKEYSLDSASLFNAAPNYVAYRYYLDENVQGVQFVLLGDEGTFTGTTTFHGETMVSVQDGNNVRPATAHMLVTYPASAPDFNQADELSLHRHTHGAVTGPISHNAVKRLTIGDGFGRHTDTSWAFDRDTAGCDPSGLVAKYYRTTTCPGTGDPKQTPYGRTVRTFYNGVGDDPSEEVPRILDGIWKSIEVYDAEGRLRRRKSSDLEAIRTIASPGPDGWWPRALAGGFPALTRVTREELGVQNTSTFEFVPEGFPGSIDGTPVASTTSYVDAEQVTHHTRTTSVMAAPLNPALVAIYRLEPRALVVSQRRTGNESTWRTESAHATTFTTWTTGDGPAVPATEANFNYLDAKTPDFPFSQYQPGDDAPPGWVLGNRITHREPGGQKAENRGPDGVPGSTLYDAEALFALAHCSNAEADGFVFRAFEPYESTQGWQARGLAADPDDAMMGAHGGRLSADGYLSTTVRPRRAETYLVGCWYKTPAGVTPATGTEVKVTATAGKKHDTQTTAFPASDGAWRYLSVPVDLTKLTGEEAIELDVRFANAGPQDLWLDAVRIAPLVSQFKAVTLDHLSRVPTAVTELDGSVHRIGLDRDFRPTLSNNVQSGAVDVKMDFRSRQGNAEHAFDPASPNAGLGLVASEGGTAETFRDGGEWTTRWQPDKASAWQAEDGGLVHAGKGQNELTAAGGLPKGTAALYFELQTASAGDAPAVSIQAGDVTIGFSDGAYHAKRKNKTWKALAQLPAIARHWALVVGRDVTLFFGDGQLLFSERTAPSGSNLKLSVGGEGTTLRHLSLLHGARMSLTYLDARGRERQTHTLDRMDGDSGSSDDTLVMQTIRDDLGRTVAATKTAPGSFGSGADESVATYRAGFVDVDAFLSRLDGDWKMPGLVSDYYAGQTEDGITRSNDEGYPYVGKRYLAEPEGKIAELGQPGAQGAINLTKPASERQTLQYEYSAVARIEAEVTADADPVFFRNTVIRPSKNGNVEFKDKRNETVAQHEIDANGNLLAQSLATERLVQTNDDGPWSRSDLKLPNAFTDSKEIGSEPSEFDAAAPAFHRITDEDAMGRPVRSDMPDSLPADTVHDDSGRARFHRPSQDGKDPWFLYVKYDVIGREIESGVVEGAWDREQLAKEANNPAWPDSGNLVHKRITYDGDGKVASLIGNVQSVEAVNPAESGAEACTVVEDFTYTSAGQVASVATSVSGAAQAVATIGYAYNAVGEITRIKLPDSAPVSEIHYTRDALGRISALGRTTGGAEFAAYRYNADGNVALEKLGDGQWQRTTSYTSGGRIARIVAGLADQSKALSFEYGHDADGLVNSRQVDDRLGKLGQFKQTFQYDGQGQYKTGSGDTALARDVETDLKYDANGNILNLDWEQQKVAFNLATGYDRLATVSNGHNSTFEYDAAGRMTSGLGRTFTYDRAHDKTRRIDMSATSHSVTFAYGGNDRRVLKQSSNAKVPDRLYIFGNERQGRPLLVRDGDDWQVLVSGPLGLVALCHENVALFPLCDALGSTWALVDDRGGLLGSFAYSPYGRLTHGTLLHAFPYLFQGREWDAETALYNFDARLYDPWLCRFLTPDPAHQNPSPYTFLGNAPLNFVDPTGMLSGGRIAAGILLAVATFVAIGIAIATAGFAGAPSMTLTGAEWAVFLGWTAVSTVASGFASGFGGAAGYVWFTPDKDFSVGAAFAAFGVGFAVGVVFAPLATVAYAAADALAATVAGSVQAGSIYARIGGYMMSRPALYIVVGTGEQSAQSVTDRALRNLATGEDVSTALGFAAILGAIAGFISGASAALNAGVGKFNAKGYKLGKKTWRASVSSMESLISFEMLEFGETVGAKLWLIAEARAEPETVLRLSASVPARRIFEKLAPRSLTPSKIVLRRTKTLVVEPDEGVDYWPYWQYTEYAIVQATKEARAPYFTWTAAGGSAVVTPVTYALYELTPLGD